MTDVDVSSFQQEVRGPGPPGLARAALLFAREIAYPDLRPSAYLAQIDDWAETLRRRLAPDASAMTRLARLNDFLFDDLGLRGNRDEYDDPRNSYLNEVIARGLGLPISLSAIFLEMAARLGLVAEGIGLPGHFVVGVHVGGSRRLLDPFHGGLALTDQEAADLVRRTTGYAGAFEPEWLNPVAPRAILARMLFNLRGLYIRQEAWPKALAVVEHLRILQPGEPSHVRDLGLLHYRNDALTQAANLLEEYLSRNPDAPDEDTVRESLSALLDHLTRRN